jgi:N-methylhydantoinase B/oxoprolinase/acetone carboxylase alpha subunit
VRLVRRGAIDADILSSSSPTRASPRNGRATSAQLAALRVGAALLRVRRTRRAAGARRAMTALQDYSERLTRAALRTAARPGAPATCSTTTASARRPPIAVAIRLGAGRAVVDFAGTGRRCPAA